MYMWTAQIYANIFNTGITLRMPSRKTIFSVLVLLLALRISWEPIPANTSQPYRLKLVFCTTKLFLNLGFLAETLGITSPVTAMRYSFGALGVIASGAPGVTARDTQFGDVRVRLYVPEGISDNAPAIVYIHGGGFVVGSIDTHHAVTSRMALEVKAVVLSLDYRLCPENTVLDGLEDSVMVTKYLLTHSAEFGIDPTRVALAGDSAGGSFAANVAIKLRDAGFKPMPKLQVLIYPSIQMIELDMPSHQQHSYDSPTDRHMSVWMRSNALRDPTLAPFLMNNSFVPPEIRKNYSKGRLNHNLLPPELKHAPYAASEYHPVEPHVWKRVKDKILKPEYSPLLTNSHKNLPEAYIYTGMNDPYRDDGFLYKFRLMEDGVNVSHFNDPKGWHGILNAFKQLSDGKNAMANIVNFINSRL